MLPCIKGASAGLRRAGKTTLRDKTIDRAVPKRAVFTARDYLLSEAWRLEERAHQAVTRNATIEAQAIATAPDFQSRIVARAKLFARSSGLDIEVQRSGQRFARIMWVLVGCGFVLGLGTVRALPDGVPAAVNVFTLLVLLLVPNLLSLILWALLIALGARGRAANYASWFGRRVVELNAWFDKRRASDERRPGAVAAWHRFLFGTRAGQMRLAIVSHGFWIGLLAGALLSCWWLFTVRQIDFYWGSTLLDEQQVADVLGTLVHPLARLDLPVPNTGELAASRFGHGEQTSLARQHWGWFVLAAIFVYGLMPRFIIAALCWIAKLHLERRLSLNLSLPAYARLRPVLMPILHHAEVIDPDDSQLEKKSSAARHSARPREIPADADWFALERAPRAAIVSTTVGRDLGVVSTRDDQRRILALAADAAATAAFAIYIELAVAPDRGNQRFLQQLLRNTQAPVYAYLAAAPTTAQWGDDDLQQRHRDWCELLQTVGIDAAHIVTAPVSTRA